MKNKIKTGYFIHKIIVFVFFVVIFVGFTDKVNASVIGYTSASSWSGGYGEYCSMSNTSGMDQYPLYDSWDSYITELAKTCPQCVSLDGLNKPYQSSGGCIQYITLTSTSTVQLGCENPLDRRLGSGGYPEVIKGPGTFRQNCPTVSGKFNSSMIRVVDDIKLVLATTSSSKTISLSWNDNFTTENEYTIERRVEGGSFTQLASLPINTTTYTDSSLASGKTYEYRVAAVLPTGLSNYSNVVRYTVRSAPTGLTAKMRINEPGKVDLSWDFVPQAVGYDIGFAFGTSTIPSKFVAIGSTTSGSITSYLDDNSTIPIKGTHEYYKVKARFADGTYSDVSNIASVSNCIKLSGNGPKKIVFLQTSTLSRKSSFFSEKVNDSINKFVSIDPYKKYSDKFSFYIDIYHMPQNFGSMNKYNFFDNPNGIGEYVRSSSSCGDDSFEYVVFIEDSRLPYDGQFLRASKNITLINLPKIENTGSNLMYVFAHESSHYIGHLDDEYVLDLPRWMEVWTQLYENVYGIDEGEEEVIPFRNCTADPAASFKYNNLWYGSNKATTTSGCSMGGTALGYPFYRASPTSLMNNSVGTLDWRLNVISCGYVISGILGEPTDKEHAKTHWAECLLLDTNKDGIPPRAPAPAISEVNPFVPLPGSVNNSPDVLRFNIKGSGFTPTDNTVKLVPVVKTSLNTTTNNNGSLLASVASFFDWIWDLIVRIFNFFISLVSTAEAQTQTSTTEYTIDNLSSADGKNLEFTVPIEVPDGEYVLSVGALNSPWANTSIKITVTGHGAYGYRVPATPFSYSCPTNYTLQSDNTCVRPAHVEIVTATSTVNATPAYSCTTGVLKLDHTCYIAGYSTTTPSYTVNPTIVYGCGYGATLSGTWCRVPGKAGYAAVAVSASCPTGSSISGNVCLFPAKTTTVPATTTASTVSYSCSSGTLSGTICTIPALTTLVPESVIKGTVSQYICAAGYVLNGEYCDKAMVITTATSTPDSVKFSWNSTITDNPVFTLIQTKPISRTLITSSSTRSYDLTSFNYTDEYCAYTKASSTTALATSTTVCIKAVPPSVQKAELIVNPRSSKELVYIWSNSDLGVNSYSLVQTYPEYKYLITGASSTFEQASYTRGTMSQLYHQTGLTSNTRYCAVVLTSSLYGSVSTSTEVCATTDSSGGHSYPSVPTTTNPVNTNPGSGGETPTDPNHDPNPPTPPEP